MVNFDISDSQTSLITSNSWVWNHHSVQRNDRKWQLWWTGHSTAVWSDTFWQHWGLRHLDKTSWCHFCCKATCRDQPVWPIKYYFLVDFVNVVLLTSILWIITQEETIMHCITLSLITQTGFTGSLEQHDPTVTGTSVFWMQVRFFGLKTWKKSLHNSPQTKSHITPHAGRLTNTKLQYDAMTENHFPFHKTYSYLVFSSVPVDSAPSFTCQLWNLSLRQCCLPRCTHF